jgi:hypothetical protein
LEQSLPGVIMSMQPNYTQFLLLLADKGCTLENSQLRDAARAMLKLMPADVETIAKMKNICQELIKNSIAQPMHGFDSLFFSPSPSQTCYNLEVCYSLLMPGTGKTERVTIVKSFNNLIKNLGGCHTSGNSTGVCDNV